jgi:hypothetical protein
MLDEMYEYDAADGYSSEDVSDIYSRIWLA